MIKIFYIAVLVLASLAGWGQQGMLLAVPADGAGALQPNEVDSLVLWLKTDAGITTGTGGVSAWADQSGNGYDFIQTDTSKRPDYGTNILNTYSSLTFDGVNDVLQQTVLKGTMLVNAAGTNTTIFAVIKITGTNNAIISDAGNSTDRIILQPDYGPSNTTYWDVGSATSTGRLSGPLAFSANSIITATRDGGDMLVRKNSVNELSGSGFTATVTAARNVFIGAYDFSGDSLTGDLYEIIVYNRALTTSEISDIESYLNNKYSIF